MMKFEVGKNYTVLDIYNRDKNTILTVLSRTDKRIMVLLNGRKEQLAVAQNAFNNNCEMCFPKGYRLVQASQNVED